ncbi:MAG: AI-2E family transporter [Nanoarchaeota archaeon]
MAKTDEAYFDKVMTALILIVLLVFSFLLLKPILLSILFGMLLAFIFVPVYDWIYKKTRSKNFSATIMIILLLLIIVIPIWFLLPLLIDQSFKIFESILQIDFITPLKTLFPNFFASEQFSTQISSVISSFLIKTANSVTNSFTDFLLDLPTISLHVLVILFTFFFVLRDRDEVADYVKSLLPFPKEVEEKLFQYSSEITKSVIYGTIFIGILQGIVAGIGFFIFSVPNALLLTLFAIIAGILPTIGTPIVWVPVFIFMLIAGNNVGAWGVFAFGMVSTWVDNILRPVFISKMTKIHSGIVLIAMIGGAFFFGILGFVIGPLVIAYLLIILELYRKKPMPGLVIQEFEKKEAK